MAGTTTTSTMSLISLALLLPTTLALPFDWSFLGGAPFERPPWHFSAPPHHTHSAPAWSHPVYTLTATSSYGPAPTLPTPTGYTYTATGTGTGTGTGAYPTATGTYWKRDAAPQWSFPPHFPPDPTFSFSFPTSYPTAGTGTGTGTGGSYPTSPPSPPSYWHNHGEYEHGWKPKEKRFFEGPRHHGGWGEHRPSFPWSWGPGPVSETATPTGTYGSAPTGFATGTVSGWPTATGYWA